MLATTSFRVDSALHAPIMTASRALQASQRAVIGASRRRGSGPHSKRTVGATRAAIAANFSPRVALAPHATPRAPAATAPMPARASAATLTAQRPSSTAAAAWRPAPLALPKRRAAGAARAMRRVEAATRLRTRRHAPRAPRWSLSSCNRPQSAPAASAALPARTAARMVGAFHAVPTALAAEGRAECVWSARPASCCAAASAARPPRARGGGD